MRLYLDTSALVKLYVDEEGSPMIRSAIEQAGLIATSAIAYIEARAAFARRRHEGGLSAGDYRRIIRDLDADWSHCLIVEVTDPLIREGARLVEAHRLRAYDAIHLASAVTVHRRLAEPVVFASWDLDLEKVARREGFEPLRLGRPP
ncbi:MAG: type II toxin-antitoxin system VapC family toxin [Candidatus Rokubacteria bacterium]|nr:type II toxin-antitoxin system VapC family toxin [Candidatus Rokubacteria bacterium]